MAHPDDRNIKASAPTVDRYAWYVVFILALGYTLSFVDRQILSLLVGPIKHDLGMSDTRIGLLQGLAFALFYSLVGLPLGRWADKTNRRNLVVGGVLLWSAFTAACSAARSFVSLFIARVGVGIGEASLSPSTYSMVADMFPKERMGVALSILCMGVFWGSSTALIVGGTVVDLLAHTPAVSVPVLGLVASWRLTFIAVGAPGLLFALLLFTVREPVRTGILRSARGADLSFREGLREIRLRWRSVALLSGGMICQATCLFGFLGWAPVFFQRIHGWSAGEVGRALGFTVLIFGCLGMYTGGRFCDRYQRKGIGDGPVRVGIPSAIGNCVLFAAAMFAPSAGWTLAIGCAAVFFVALPMGTTVAALQFIFPNQLRGQVSAIYLFIINLGGLTLGPLLPGLFNDYLFKSEKMIGPSLAITTLGAGAVMLLLFSCALRPYRDHYRLTLSGLRAASAYAD
ncbi:MAG TPA: MFS transporter [Bryobacteraceae bacterium]|nr:MFS transporter [Bryobacteraceae bacterium]